MLQSKPVVEDFFTYIESNRDIVLPKGNLGKAISYAINQRTELTAFLEDGNVPIHNNACERSVRAFCIGRRAWLFAGSPKGADASARIYSLAETAKANGLNVFKYFAFILNHLPNEKCYNSPETLDNYLPWTHLVQKFAGKKKIRNRNYNSKSGIFLNCEDATFINHIHCFLRCLRLSPVKTCRNFTSDNLYLSEVML